MLRVGKSLIKKIGAVLVAALNKLLYIENVLASAGTFQPTGKSNASSTKNFGTIIRGTFAKLNSPMKHIARLTNFRHMHIFGLLFSVRRCKSSTLFSLRFCPELQLLTGGKEKQECSDQDPRRITENQLGTTPGIMSGAIKDKKDSHVHA